MWHKFAAALFVIFIFFIVTGNYLGEQCIDVNGCKNCWKPIATSVKSDLCPDPEKACVASNEAQKHNAYVDTTLCACDKARIDEFSNPTTNKQISDLVLGFSGFTVAPNEVSSFCQQPTVAVKQRYG